MKGTKSASRYAKALLELAVESNQVDAVLNDMKYLASVANDSREFQLLIQSPIINSDKKITIFKELFGSFQKLSFSFIELITKKRRELLIAEIANSFEDQVNLYKGITPVTITSAVPLNEDIKKKILDKIKGITSNTVELTEKVDASLIGGFIVRAGDKQIDASVANQLNNLKQRLSR
ncbi:MAG: ATP synthase F1 subunit delta [Crocinitomicaceae bacterium]|nr:ATP synthase F1 subunit delta [Crocinitomicaceae bacterium]